ncbi:septum site-determining protein Ssd [Thalassiella azotivora]
MTESSELVDAVRPVAAAVGVTVATSSTVGRGRSWTTSALVLLGDDLAARGVPGRRAGVVVVGLAGGERFWRSAVDAGAEQALVLPQDGERLVHVLAAVADGDHVPGSVVAVLGGCGGAGATAVAACLAARSARDRPTVLVDLDPLGAGADALLGCDDAPGLRWSDLLDLDGPVRAELLREALPRAGDLPVLGFGPTSSAVDPPTAAVESVLDAARRRSRLVVVDLPRHTGPGALAAIARSDTVVLVVPALVRAVVAARRVLDRVEPLAADVRLVVRGPAPTGLDPLDAADALGVPLDAWWPDRRGRQAADLDRGALPGPRSPLGRWCDAVLASLEPSGARPAAGANGRPGGAA